MFKFSVSFKFGTFPITLTVWQGETVRDNGYRPSFVIQSIYLISETWSRTEVLQIPVERVGEVNILVTRVDPDVVEGAELSAEVIVQQHFVMSASQYDSSRGTKSSYLWCYRAGVDSLGRWQM